MKKLLLASLLSAVAGNAVAGWYQVTNYVGQIGPNSVHFSIQKYYFGPGTTVEGSYYYDRYLSPIPLYGLENHDKSLLLCEAHTPAEYDKALLHGFKDGSYAAGCPIHLSLTDEGAVGRWSDLKHTYAISLTRIGSLDDRKKVQISGAMEIPFWGQTDKYAFVGLYQSSAPEVKVRVINKETGQVVQTFEPQCAFGYYMTPIYMNIERSHFSPEEVLLNCAGSRDSELAYYSFNKETGKFQLSHEHDQ